MKALLWLEFLLLNKIFLFKIAVKSDLFKLLRNNLLVGASLSRYTWKILFCKQHVVCGIRVEIYKVVHITDDFRQNNLPLVE